MKSFRVTLAGIVLLISYAKEGSLSSAEATEPQYLG